MFHQQGNRKARKKCLNRLKKKLNVKCHFLDAENFSFSKTMTCKHLANNFGFVSVYSV
jgi:hypothetical protein